MLINLKNLSKTCKIFEFYRIGLKRWFNRQKKDNSIKRYSRKPASKIKPINYKNYFQYAHQKETYPKYERSKSTLRKTPKNYKLDK